MCRAVESAVHKPRQVIGHADLLDQAPDDQCEARPEVFRTQHHRALQLWQKIAGPYDGTRDQLREEPHVQRKLPQRIDRLHFSEVDIERVAQGLERIKRDPDRQKDIQGRDLRTPAEATKEGVRALQSEVGVLEYPSMPRFPARLQMSSSFRLRVPCCNRSRGRRKSPAGWNRPIEQRKSPRRWK